MFACVYVPIMELEANDLAVRQALGSCLQGGSRDQSPQGQVSDSPKIIAKPLKYLKILENHLETMDLRCFSTRNP